MRCNTLRQRVTADHTAIGAVGVDQHAECLPAGIEPFKRCRQLLRFEDDQFVLARHISGLENAGYIDIAEERTDVIVSRCRHDFIGRSNLHHLAVLHDADTVADAHGFIQIVADENDRPAVLRLKALQFVLHFGADQRVKCGKRLVHQKNGRLAGKGPRQSDALFHAAGKLVRHAVSIGLQPDGCECLQCFLVTFRLTHPGYFKTEGGIVQDRAIGQKREGLKHHAHVAAAKINQLALCHFDDIAAIDFDGTRSRFDQAIEQTQKRGFARARKAHNNESPF